MRHGGVGKWVVIVLMTWWLAGASVASAQAARPAYAGVVFRLVANAQRVDDLHVVSATGEQWRLQKRPIITAADIESIRRERDVDGTAVVDVRFRPQARQAIERVTHDNVGRQVVVMAGDQVIVATRIAGPFSESMRWSGLAGEGDADRMFEALTQGPAQRKPHGGSSTVR